ncbi:MAG: 6-bladed beta-propeller [Candidatus Longimicrobiales bacterium M2_2A_002]
MSPIPELELGREDGDSRALLSRVVSAVRLDDGSIAVADADWREVRIFDEDGSFRRAMGGQGGGPGEFRALSWMRRLPGDTLVLYDPFLDRVTRFSAEGELLAEGVLPLAGYGVRLRVYGPLGDREYIAAVDVEPRGRRETGPEGPVVDSLLLVRAAAGSSSTDTLGWTRPIEQFRVRSHGPGPVATLTATPPAWPSLHLASGRDRLYLGHSATSELRALTPAGEETWIPVPWASGPVRTPDLEHWKRLYIADGPASWEELRQRAIDGAEDRSMLPYHGDLLVDRDGDLWVARYAALGDTAAVRWRVMSPNGDVRFDVVTPGSARLMNAGKRYVLLLVRSEYDTPLLRLHQLTVPSDRNSVE